MDATFTAQEVAMQNGKKVDRALNEARKKAAERACLPQADKKSYNVSVISGRVGFSKKKNS